jgi:hypothetical protein
MKTRSRQWTLAALIIAMACATPAALATDFAAIDSSDKEALERALYLCLWRTSHDVPDDAPIPAVCKSATVSIDDALLQSKQWWTFWARLNPAEAQQANTRFGTDALAFEARQRQQPQLASELLPQGIKLARDDWRVLLVRELMTPANSGANGREKAPGKPAD